MSTSSLTWTEGTTKVAGLDLHIVKGGSGDPLLVLHDEMGQTAPLRYAEELARDFTLHMPAGSCPLDPTVPPLLVIEKSVLRAPPVFSDRS